MVNTDLSVEDGKRNNYIPLGTVLETEKRGKSWFFGPNVTVSFFFFKIIIWCGNPIALLVLISKKLREVLLPKNLIKTLFYADSISC